MAELLHQEENLYSKCMNLQATPTELKAMLNVAASDYWDEHLRFGMLSEKQKKQVSDEVVKSILYEAVVPIRELFKLNSDDQE